MSNQVYPNQVVYAQGYPQQGYPPQGYPQGPAQPQMAWGAPSQPPPPMVMTQQVIVPPAPADSLQGLTMFPSLYVRQRIRNIGAEMCGCQTEDQFEIYTPAYGASKILTAQERSGACMRCWCASRRSFEMEIHTNDGRQAIYIERPFHMSGGGYFCYCCDFGWQEIRVYSGRDTAMPNRLLGRVIEDFAACQLAFSVVDGAGLVLYRIVGNCGVFGVNSFSIISGTDLNGDACGEICRTFNGYNMETFLGADSYYVMFPPAAPAEHRALFLGALVLIDLMYFSKRE